jgi:plasmid stabilization system protein ParE
VILGPEIIGDGAGIDVDLCLKGGDAANQVFGGGVPGLRVTFHGAYAIYDQPTETEIVIVRVLHGARDAAAIADRSGFAG